MQKKNYQIDGHMGVDDVPEELKAALRYLSNTVFIESYDVVYTVGECEYCGWYFDVEANLTDEEVEQIIKHYNSL